MFSRGETVTVHIRKNTQKSKFLLTQMEKNMFFVIPEMPSKTFVMVLKKLLDHFKNVTNLGTRITNVLSLETEAPVLPATIHHKFIQVT